MDTVCHIKPLRHIKPESNANVATWLRLLALSEGEHQNLIRWLSSAPSLSECLPALCLVGPPRVGKSLLTAGVSAYWGGGPGDYQRVVKAAQHQGFADDLIHSPVSEAPERVQPGSDAALYLAEFLMNFEHYVHRKGEEPVKVIGHARVIFESNYDYNVPVGTLVIHGDAMAAQFLKSVDTRGWVLAKDGSPGAIARHVESLRLARLHRMSRLMGFGDKT